jgi:hypothetical protein
MAVEKKRVGVKLDNGGSVAKGVGVGNFVSVAVGDAVAGVTMAVCVSKNEDTIVPTADVIAISGFSVGAAPAHAERKSVKNRKIVLYFL